MPKRFLGATLEKAPEPVRNYANDLDANWGRGKGLMLCGPPGRGKTHMACALMQLAVPKYKAAFVTFPHMIEWVQESIAASRAGDAEEYERYRRPIRNMANETFDFYVIDDVGKEYRTTSGFAEAKLDFILRRRYDLGCPTIVTTNLLVEDWAEIYGDAMGSFIHEAFLIVPVIGKDLRKN